MLLPPRNLSTLHAASSPLPDPDKRKWEPTLAPQVSKQARRLFSKHIASIETQKADDVTQLEPGEVVMNEDGVDQDEDSESSSLSSVDWALLSGEPVE